MHPLELTAPSTSIYQLFINEIGKIIHWMDLTAWVGLWGGVVSTSLAVLQFRNWWHARPRLIVSSSWSHKAASNSEDENGIEILVPVRRGKEFLKELASLQVTISNHGDKAVQVVGVVIESRDGERVNIQQVTPSQLPTVVEPRTSVETCIQKEFLDMADQVTFFGVVDAMGRHHEIPHAVAIPVINQSWMFPTRVKRFQRRGHPEEAPVMAFQASQRSTMKSRPARKTDRPFIIRSERALYAQVEG